MPEFPEVATVIAYLRKNIIGEIISKIEIFHPKVYKGEVHKVNLDSVIYNQKIKSITQKGKNIILNLSSGYLIAHLRMEGKFYFQPKNFEEPKIERWHIGYIVKFSSKSQLWFHDKRRFGTLHYAADTKNMNKILSNVGPDPFAAEMNAKRLFNSAHNRRQMIKPFLLNQKTMSGIGNIYADEVLYCCGIHPATTISSLQLNDWAEILAKIRHIFVEAIKQGGTTIFSFHNNFVDGKFKNNLNVYGRTSLECHRCKTLILKIRIGQRGTHYCPNCQKKPQFIIRPKIYFLTGKICSGKTTIMHKLKKQKAVQLIFADKIINDLYLTNKYGWKLISKKFPTCIHKNIVDKVALYQLIKNDQKILTIIETNLYNIFFNELNKKIRTILSQQKPNQKNRNIFIEIPYKKEFCNWIMTSNIFRAVIIYLVVNKKTQIARLRLRNKINFQTAEMMCNIFNKREYHLENFKQIIINNNCANVDSTILKLINKIYL